jgi:pimeloyl-ACP methyl ester carboxylesterase
MPFAHANGVRLFYDSVGEGVPLLFIHGGYGGAATTLAPRN